MESMLGYGRFKPEKKSVNDDAFSVDGTVDSHPGWHLHAVRPVASADSINKLSMLDY